MCNEIDKKELNNFIDERHSAILEVLICFAIIVTLIFGAFLFGIKFVFHPGHNFILLEETEKLSDLLDILLLFVLVWGLIWMIKIVVVKIQIIQKLNKTITAGRLNIPEEFNRQKTIYEMYYKNYIYGKAVSPVKPPFIGRRCKKINNEIKHTDDT